MRRTLLILIASCIGMIAGCGPSRTRPTEIDLSGLPAPVLEQFRRDRPNSIALDVSKQQGDAGQEWRIVHYTPRADKKVTVYSDEGVKLRGW